MRALLSPMLILGLLTLAAQASASPPPPPGAVDAPRAGREKLISLRIIGFRCGNCASSAEQALRKIDGVRAASVSFEKGLAVVRVDGVTVVSEREA